MYKGQIVSHSRDGECRFLYPHSPQSLMPARLREDYNVTPPSSPDLSFLAHLGPNDTVPLRLEYGDLAASALRFRQTSFDEVCVICDAPALQKVSVHMPRTKALHVFPLCMLHVRVPESKLVDLAATSDGRTKTQIAKCANCLAEAEAENLLPCPYCKSKVFCGEWCTILSKVVGSGMATHVCVSPSSKEHVVVPDKHRPRSKSSII